MSQAIVVNLFGGPGTGKSTLAYELIGKLKRNDYKAELVVEHVKGLAFSNNITEMQDQVLLAAHDNHRIKVLSQQCDFVVMDGSILNGLGYIGPNDNFERLMSIELYNRHKNVGYLLPRKDTYIKYGRMQTKEEAIELDQKIFDLISFLPEESRVDLRHMKVEDLLDYIYNDIIQKKFGE